MKPKYYIFIYIFFTYVMSERIPIGYSRLWLGQLQATQGGGNCYRKEGFTVIYTRGLMSSTLSVLLSTLEVPHSSELQWSVAIQRTRKKSLCGGTDPRSHYLRKLGTLETALATQWVWGQTVLYKTVSKNQKMNWKTIYPVFLLVYFPWIICLAFSTILS